MASLADDIGVKGAGIAGGAARPPISTHPAFPFIVALWFAALLGVGSLVVPVPVIEQLAVATGLASIFPPAAPPLGFTARAMIALAFTAGGAVAGLLIARQVARAHSAEPAPRRKMVASAPVREPISAIDELGDEGLDGRMLTGKGRGRRALAIEPEEGPSEFLELAPLPGSQRDAHQAIGLSAWDPAQDTPAIAIDEAAAIDEFELTEDLLAEEMPAEEAFAQHHPVAPADTAQAAAQPRQVFGAAPGFTTFEPVPVTLDPLPETGHATMDDRQYFAIPDADAEPPARQEFTPAPAEPVPADIAFSPPSLARVPQAFEPDDGAADDADWIEDGVDYESDHAAEFWAEEGAAPAAMEEPAAEPMIDQRQFASHARPVVLEDEVEGCEEARQLDDMGLVQLAQRLGASIERRREQRAARAALAASAAPLVPPAAPPLRVLDEDIEFAAPDEAAEAMAAWFGQPAPSAEAAVEAEHEFAEPADREQVYPNAAPAPAAAGRQVFQPVAPEDEEPCATYRPLGGLAQIDIGEEDEDEDGDIADLAASFTLPLSRPAPPAMARQDFAAPTPTVSGPMASAPAPLPAGNDEGDDLAALRNPFLQRPQAFVRIEDEPVADDQVGEPAVVFPSQAAPAPAPAHAPAIQPQPSAAPFHAFPQPLNAEEHERALREALLNLQRMSGAA